MRDNTFEKVRSNFSNELKSEGDVWRVLRKGTLADLIKLNYFHFQSDKSEKHLIKIFNNAMKIKLLSRIKAIEIEGSLEEVSKKFNKEPEFILEQYDKIFSELHENFKSDRSVSVYDLNENIQYIKVINDLEIDSYADDVFEVIIEIIYKILEAE